MAALPQEDRWKGLNLEREKTLEAVVIEAGVTDDLTEDGLRERRTTDVAETDEEYAYALTL